MSTEEFEWDEDKRDSNLLKHGIDFARAQFVFTDPRHYVEEATTSPDGELRWKAVGSVTERIVCVIYTQRGTRRRIISARRARRNEREQYRQGQGSA